MEGGQARSSAESTYFACQHVPLCPSLHNSYAAMRRRREAVDTERCLPAWTRSRRSETPIGRPSSQMCCSTSSTAEKSRTLRLHRPTSLTGPRSEGFALARRAESTQSCVSRPLSSSLLREAVERGVHLSDFESARSDRTTALHTLGLLSAACMRRFPIREGCISLMAALGTRSRLRLSRRSTRAWAGSQSWRLAFRTMRIDTRASTTKLRVALEEAGFSFWIRNSCTAAQRREGLSCATSTPWTVT